MNNIVLLTSTIKPNSNQPGLKLTNPEDRLEDYREALAFYSMKLREGTIDRIVFVDNSGFDLKCLSDIFPSKNIEWISFFGLDYPLSYHRGYGEFKLIDYAFANSSNLRKLETGDIVWKITGRYIVKNLKSIIKYAPRQFDLYCDIRKNWVDMGIMAWSSAGYENHVKGMSENFKTAMPPELIMSQRIREQVKSSDRVVTNFYRMPLIIGRRGFDGGLFQGKFTYVKFLLLSCINLAKFPFRNFMLANRTKKVPK